MKKTFILVFLACFVASCLAPRNDYYVCANEWTGYGYLEAVQDVFGK